MRQAFQAEGHGTYKGKVLREVYRRRRAVHLVALELRLRAAEGIKEDRVGLKG